MESVYHSQLYSAAGSAIMSFDPVKQIHQHLCAFHTYSHDRSRHVEAHHFCTHLSPDFHQCVIYDSENPHARLIGIEYIVSEKIFEGLPEEEKKYWHSHKYEVESGLLQMQTKRFVPGAITNFAEKPAMANLQKTYGKTIHTWPVDVSPELPLGPPSLMMAYTSDEQVPHELVRERDERLGMDTEGQKKRREGYLPSYEKNNDADAWEKTGRGVEFMPH
ncbi:hypothetical protein AGABI2DRAFT_201214 [Agaricus bisporus var. bisporus H97]|uniref:hypothetical protein n=1 Tax=Agaricus bisporus var. bisporus (strain H97 / ATCC MYA-4626 / FGSC 10389) TaxID=936046 RepID=UPI00029F7F1F|nr:hypothetical protein AGABI2DRAFT_201214 [Agaricus bisporus var. bisporus H97]EKV49131.1 hypothetical protein AGABI2DRAFT_201214 [Agaricus bisporus var. bisporus H97]